MPTDIAQQNNIGTIHPTGEERQERPPLCGLQPESGRNRVFCFENSYARLHDRFYARVAPSAARVPRIIELNRDLAVELGVDPDWLAGPTGAEILSGRLIPDGAQLIGLAYAGHQFGHFVPQLGDGRAILLGEALDRQGVRCDIQLKGSGVTPFSRRGDGRAPLGPVLREYVVGQFMAADGIPTTRALAAVETGETVVREQSQPGAILARVAASHVRVGTFQYFAARRDIAAADDRPGGSAAALFDQPEKFDSWAEKWRERLAAEGRDSCAREAAMLGANPMYIPRNHLVEAAISAAVVDRDYAPFRRLLEAVTRPF